MMTTDFNEVYENELLNFIQKYYGAEVFTPGLERTKPLYEHFIREHKKQKVKVTIIAGTNGKGQTAHTLSHYLNSSGRSVALWTSPHILSLRERFVFNDGMISYEDLKKEIEQTHQDLESKIDFKVSFYEFLFLVFLRLSFLKDKTFEHIILEVGLGGRLDAVNHFDADCTCITSISRDHQAILGNRFDLILAEKIAVSRRGVPLFTNFQSNYLNELTQSYSQKHGIDWRPLHFKNTSYFLSNQKMAQALYDYLEPERKCDFLQTVPLFKGRREKMTIKGFTLIFIGAHNIDGIRRMIEQESTGEGPFNPERLLISFSKRPVDEIEVMLKSLHSHFGANARLSLCHFEHPKACERAILQDLFLKIMENNKRYKGLLDFVDDWKSELNKNIKQKILVCGSYYFIGEVQRYLLSLP